MSFSRYDRRQLLQRATSGLALATFRAEAFADELARTPWATEGPFYPYSKLPLDRDNDLVQVGKSLTPAVGTITHLGGRVLDTTGSPIRGATVEIWQTDGKGVYLAQGRTGDEDRNFQGWGQFETASDGAYRFRTIRPVIYPGRAAPHIHFRINVKGRRALTTQLFIQGHPGNARDNVFRQIGDASAQALVAREFVPVEGSKIGEQAVRFDIVLGATPAEDERARFDRPAPRRL